MDPLALSTTTHQLSTHFPDRLFTLCDGRRGLRGTIHAEVREPATESPVASQAPPILEFTSSDETLDRYNEILSASGWRLANYQLNPVFQNSHQYGDIIFTLGRALATEVRGGKLFQRIQFATDVNPMAKIAYGLYRGKFLNAVSVGFIPIRWLTGNQESGYSRKYIAQELLEVSAVSIPANPNALALGYKSGAVEKSDIRELAQLLKSLEGKDAIRGVPEENSTQLDHVLRLAETVNGLLKKL